MGHLDVGVFPHFLPARLLLLLLFCIFGFSVGTELSFVTCGSVIKLLNLKHNVRLHSHDVRYGSGEFPLIINNYNTLTTSYVMFTCYINVI